MAARPVLTHSEAAVDRFPWDVCGWLTEAEGQALYRLAEGRRVLEVGSYQGRSTICLAYSALWVVSVDWHRGDAGTGRADTLPAFCANLERYGVASKVRKVVARVQDVADLFAPGVFDLAFVDGAHDRESVLRDAEFARRVVRPGGAVAFHDWPDVGPFDWLGTPAGAVDGLAWFGL